MKEPSNKRVSFFIDGQNLFHGIKEAFGYRYPNYDVRKLSRSVCEKQGWGEPVSIHFYTGVHEKEKSPQWNGFWRRKLDEMKKDGVSVFSRPLVYSRIVHDPEGSSQPEFIGREKGIDVRLALDVIREVSEDTCNIAVIFSQDQDLSEVAKDVRSIARREKRWIKIASAFPFSTECGNARGINYTDWIKIDKKTYDKCIDPKDYRPEVK